MKENLVKTVAIAGLLFAGGLRAQQSITVTTIVVIGDQTARQKSEKEILSDDIKNIDASGSKQNEVERLTPFGLNTSSPTAAGKKIEEEIMRITKEKLEKAHYIVTIIEPEKKTNKFG